MSVFWVVVQFTSVSDVFAASIFRAIRIVLILKCASQYIATVAVLAIEFTLQ